jgi:proline iminopeptidase
MGIFAKVMTLALVTANCRATDLSTSHPAQLPRQEGYLQVSDTHQIFYAVYGNPTGIPVVVLHGGPGMGCKDKPSPIFDLHRFNVIMFDQRGAMRSKPFACMEDNTTQLLIEDIEKLRCFLGIEKWVVFGGSWGSLLGVLYGEAHPNACIGFVLSGIFLGREQDLQLFREKGAAYREFVSLFSKEEQRDVLTASYERVLSPDPEKHMSLARAFFRYIMLGTIYTQNSAAAEPLLKDDRLALSMSRATLHYAHHQLFLAPNQALSQIDRISHLPAIIVQGAEDLNCPPEQAKLLHQHWKNSQLFLIEEGGHAADDSATTTALINAIESFANPT